MFRFIKVAALGAAAVAVLAMAAACTEDSDSESLIEVASAMEFIDNSGFHGIDESINDDEEIPATAASDTRKAQAVLALTTWPEDLQDEAEALERVFDDLATALEAEEPDLAAAGELATQAHDGQHDFSAAVWAYLREEAGQEVEPHGDDGHN